MLIVNLSYYYASRFCTACSLLSDHMKTADYLSSHIITLTATPASLLHVYLTMWNISGKTPWEKKSNILHYSGVSYHCQTLDVQLYPLFPSLQKAEVKEILCAVTWAQQSFTLRPLPSHSHVQGKTLPCCYTHEASFPIIAAIIQLLSI